MLNELKAVIIDILKMTDMKGVACSDAPTSFKSAAPLSLKTFVTKFQFIV